jgi:membrane-bound lytic murein transglycosylase D
MTRRPGPLLVVVAGMLLTACATPPPRTPAIAVASVAPAPFAVAPIAIVVPEPTTPAPTDTWARLRASFAMDDCDSDPAVLRTAQRFAVDPRRLERHLDQVLPTLDYVQRIAARHGVPGEFVLLPWVESHYRAVPPRRHRPAGMWQIMPVTARAMDLQVGAGYDARLDKVAASEAVMRLLAGYHARWHDWRLADLAYNTGEYRVRRLVRQYGLPPARPVIPSLPVGRITRQHLTKLLAIACVVREPQRFHVHLPALDAARRLQVVELPAPMSLRQVARLASLPLTQVETLNAGYRAANLPASGPWRLLLPAAHATRLLAAVTGSTLSAPGIADQRPVGRTREAG